MYNLAYFVFVMTRIWGFYRNYKKDTQVRRQTLALLHLVTLIAKIVVNFLHFFGAWKAYRVWFPFWLTVGMLITDFIQVYHVLVARQVAANYPIDAMRAQAYTASLVSNSGIICAEDTNVWQQ